MNTQHRPTRFTPTSAGLVHESSRTSIAANRDPDTGLMERVMTNSRLRLVWSAGELRITCECSKVRLPVERPMRAMRRER